MDGTGQAPAGDREAVVTMAKPQQFDIILENPHSVYKAGTVVSGSLILQADQPQSYTSLGLKFSGKGKVDIVKTLNCGRKEHFIEKESYFKREVRVLPRGSGSVSNMTMEQGHHEFPFTFNLPTSIPSSFECTSGYVRYCVKAKLELGWSNSVSVKKYFIVFKPLDLNDHRSTRLPGEHNSEATCCLPRCTPANISAGISIPKTGFIPGENIPVQWQITNMWVRKIYFTIEEVSHCHAANTTKDESETLTTHHSSLSAAATTETRVPEVIVTEPQIPEVVITEAPEAVLTETEAPTAEDITTDIENDDPAPSITSTTNTTNMRTGRELITVPVAVPSGLEDCRIIDLEHRLVLHVESVGFACCLEVPVNIMIGTTPLGDEHYYTYEEEEEESPPGYDSGYSNSQESLPRRNSVPSGNGIIGVQPPGYSATAVTQELESLPRRNSVSSGHEIIGEQPPGYSANANAEEQESLPRRNSVSSGGEVMGDEPPGYSARTVTQEQGNEITGDQPPGYSATAITQEEGQQDTPM